MSDVAGPRVRQMTSILLERDAQILLLGRFDDAIRFIAVALSGEIVMTGAKAA